MLTKIKTHKIKYQPNIRICLKLLLPYKNQCKTNYQDQFKFNEILKGWNWKKKNQIRSNKKKKNWKIELKKEKKRDNTFNIHMNN